jgi:peptidoglycan DL-endopeptidase CwlO
MASHRAPKNTAGRAAAFTVLGVTAGSVALMPGVSQASPAPTFDQAKTEVSQLNAKAEVATQEYDADQAQYVQLQKKVDGLQAQIVQDQASLNQLQSSLGMQAAAQYRDGGISPTLQLALAASPDKYLTDAGIASQTASQDAVQLKAIDAEKAQLASDQATAASDLAQEQATIKAAAANKAQIQSELSKARSVLDRFTAEQQIQLEGGGGIAKPGNLPPVSGRAGTAVAYAEEKAADHDPYVWGATGPNQFDCSGLTSAAWAAAGVSIPRTSEEQYYGLTRIPLADVEPGDLIFYIMESGGPAHVAMYVGDGTIVQAPHTGTDVSYAPMYESGMEPVGAARP